MLLGTGRRGAAIGGAVGRAVRKRGINVAVAASSASGKRVTDWAAGDGVGGACGAREPAADVAVVARRAAVRYRGAACGRAEAVANGAVAVLNRNK